VVEIVAVRLTSETRSSSVRGDNWILKNRYYVLLAFAIMLPLATVAANLGAVSAETCGLQVGSMAANTQYSGGYYYGPSNPYSIQLTVPLSLACQNFGNPLWVVGTAYDTVTASNLGSNNIVMNWYNGYYGGQLVFQLPMSVVSHQLQIQIQVFNTYNNGQYSGLVAAASPTVTIDPTGYYQPYGYYNGYPYGYYNGYYYYYGNPYYYSYGYPYYPYCPTNNGPHPPEYACVLYPHR